MSAANKPHPEPSGDAIPQIVAEIEAAVGEQSVGNFFSPHIEEVEARALSPEAVQTISAAFEWAEDSRRDAEKWTTPDPAGPEK